MTFPLTSVALISAAMAFAGPPKIPDCFKVHDLLKADQDHYWANWSNQCPYTIDSVYVSVRFSDRSGGRLGESVWALHFLLPGAHRVTRFSTPGSLDDFDSVRVHKIMASSEEAFLHLQPAAFPAVAQPERPHPVLVLDLAVPGRPAPPAESVSAVEHHRHARQLIQERNYRAAIAELSEAIRQKPDFSQAFNARGFARYMSRQYRPALDDLDQAIRLNPAYLNAYQNRRQVRRASGDLKGSAADARTIRGLSRNAGPAD